VIALLRYQAALLFRSARWIFPLLAYVALVAVDFAGQEPLRDGLDWSAAMLVPATALLTRAMLTAEPPAARACVAAARGPVRAQLATLTVALAGGAGLALAGVLYDLLTDEAAGAKPDQAAPGLAAKFIGLAHHPAILAAGLLTALVCLLTGAALGALCNPPVLRRPAVALLGTLSAVVFSLIANISPVSAAARGTSAAPQAAGWPGAGSVLLAAGLLAVCWTVSALAAAHRG
jgi:hypothetical protein